MGNRINIFIFALGLVLTTATQFRFFNSPVGFGELLLLTWAILAIFNMLNNNKLNLFDSYTFINLALIYIMLLAMIVGWINGIILNQNQDSFHDLIAYFFSFSLIIILLVLNKIDFEILIKYLYCIGFYSQMIFFIAYLLNVEVVKYGERFTSWSENPNQLAMLLLILPFLGLKLCKDSKGISRKLAYIISVVLIVTMGVSSMSDALLVSWTFIVALYLIFFVSSIKTKSLVLLYGKLIVIIGIPAVILFNLTTIEVILSKIYAEGNQGNVRFQLWENGLFSFFKSFLLGYGPGSFSSNNVITMEAHNTYIDLTTNFGMLGLVSLILLQVFSLSKAYISKQYALTGLIIAMMIFSVFHHLGRQPIYWLVFIMIFLNLKEEKGKSNYESKANF